MYRSIGPPNIQSWGMSKVKGGGNGGTCTADPGRVKWTFSTSPEKRINGGERERISTGEGK